MLEIPKRDRRAERREATRTEILAAAWDIARAEGLAAVSVRDIADRVGLRAPSLYGYFDSKHAIFDAMFAQAAQQFADGEPTEEVEGPLEGLQAMVHYFVRFCAEDVARYQLLFQRTIPGFEPSPESFAISQESLTRLGARLRTYGVADEAGVDLLTALGTGLADQQISNDPGGDRWIRLVDEAAEMFYDHITKRSGVRTKETRA